MVHLDPRAKWNNGEPVTVDDVIYTFHIDSILPTPRNGNWHYIKSVTSEGDNKISFNFSKTNKNPLIILNAIAETSILPKAVFEPLVQSAKSGKNYDFSKITEFKNDEAPVVSGPYNLKTFSPDKIVLERDANYWGLAKYNGALPAPKYIIHSLYNGNNHFNSAMTKGNLDISSIFLPRIWDKAKDSIRAWSREEPYHLPGSITTLIVSFKSAPLTDVAFRQAMIHAINFEKIKTWIDASPNFFLSRLYDDIAYGHITLNRGVTVNGYTDENGVPRPALEVKGDSTFTGNLSSPEFVSDFLGGQGWTIQKKEFVNSLFSREDIEK